MAYSVAGHPDCSNYEGRAGISEGETMKKIIGVLVCAIALLGAGAALAELIPELAVLEPFVGKTYEGRFTDAASGRELTDVQTWEVILGGKAIRTMHSLNDGEYGGESVVYWDTKAETLAYFYVTTGGFVTRGTMEAKDGEFTATEFVEGDADGVTEVRSTSRVNEDGSMHLSSEYKQNGEWVPGHEIAYVENPDAKVVFQ